MIIYIYVYVTHTYIYIYLHTHINMYIYIHTHICVYIYIYIHIHTYTYIFTYICMNYNDLTVPSLNHGLDTANHPHISTTGGQILRGRISCVSRLPFNHAKALCWCFAKWRFWLQITWFDHHDPWKKVVSNDKIPMFVGWLLLQYLYIFHGSNC